MSALPTMAPTPKPSSPAPTALPLPAFAIAGEMVTLTTAVMAMAARGVLFIVPGPWRVGMR